MSKDNPQPEIGARWEHFAHGADVGVRGFGQSLAQAFEQTGLALTAVVTDPARVRPSATVEVTCDAPDLELLLFDWLNAVVYEMATRRMLFGRFRVRVQGLHLDSHLEGEPVDVARHHPAVELKGATCTALKVAKTEDIGWVAQCVVDV